MRFRQASRRGTVSWWGIALCALLFASAYVVFDILDLDGSQLSRGPALDGTLTATVEEAGERFVRTPVIVAGSVDLLPLPLSRLSENTPRLNSSAGKLRHQRWVHALPRVTLSTEPTRVGSPTADPL